MTALVVASRDALAEALHLRALAAALTPDASP